MKLGELEMHCGECAAIEFCGAGFGYAICSDSRFSDVDDMEYARATDGCPAFDGYPECAGCESEECWECEHDDGRDDYNAEHFADYVFGKLKRSLTMKNTIEILFGDLTPKKQAEVLAKLGDNGNFDVFPLAVIPVGEDDPGYEPKTGQET
jgi:hypothetical protein